MTKKVTNNEELMISGLTGSVSSLSSVTNEVQDGNKVVSYINNVTGEKIMCSLFWPDVSYFVTLKT